MFLSLFFSFWVGEERKGLGGPTCDGRQAADECPDGGGLAAGADEAVAEELDQTLARLGVDRGR